MVWTLKEITEEMPRHSEFLKPIIQDTRQAIICRFIFPSASVRYSEL